MVEKTTSSLFQRLRPVCINVTKDCSVRHLNEAIAAFKSLNKYDINEVAMLEYVLFPFRMTLQKKKTMKEDQEILCFTCLQVIFSKCHPSVIKDQIISWCMNTFSLYFVSKTLNEDDKQKEKFITVDVSEEQKLSIVKFILSIFTNMNSNAMIVIYNEKYLPVLGHVISILLNIIEMEKNRDLQVVALNCLKTLSGSSFQDKQCCELAGKCWSSFLPGICMTFNRLFTTNDKVGQNLFESSLDTFAYIIYVVLNDDLNADIVEKEFNLKDLLGSKSSNEAIDMDTKRIGVKRTKEWLQSTSSNLNLVFKNIFPVIICQFKVKVQLALLAFIEKLLMTCMKTLASSILDLLDVLLKYSCDESEEIKNESNRILETCMKIFHDTNIAIIKNALTERLYSELLSLPRIMNSSNDDMKIAKLQLVKGYMKFYGKNMSETLNTYALLQRFVTSLIHILELETDNVNLVEEQTSIFRLAIDTSPETYDNRFYRKTFKYFRTIGIYKLIKDVIQLMSKYGSVEILIDYLLEQSKNFLTCKQSFLILNEILLGMDCPDTDQSNSFVDSILSCYLDDQLMKLPVSNAFCRVKDDNMLLSDEGLINKHEIALKEKLERDALPFEVLNSNIQLICILLEGVSNCAEVLKTEFDIWMIQVLYILLEKVGCTNAAVSLAAVETLNNIVRFCNYNDISELIFRNSDYLLNSITLQFRRITYGAAAPAVLCVVLRFCDSSLIPMISDVIGEVFNVLDEYQEEVADDLLLVLKDYNMAVDKCYAIADSGEDIKKNFDTKNIEKKSTDVSNDNISVADFLDEYCKLTLHSQGIIDEKDYLDVDIDDDIKNNGFQSDDPDCEQSTEEETKEETPFHYKIVITSLEKCVAYTAASDSRIKSKALDVVLNGVSALKDRENDLLPLIHKLWPPIICRLKDKDPILALKAFDVVCSMVEYSGNFMTKRMTTDFIPYAVRILNDSFMILIKNKSNFTQHSKMIRKLISFLGNIIPTLNVITELFLKMSSAIFPYTSCYIHLSIQEEAILSLHKFYSHRPNVIWFYTFRYVNDDWTTPQNTFKPLSYEKLKKDSEQYRSNILKLQNVIKEKDIITEEK